MSLKEDAYDLIVQINIRQQEIQQLNERLSQVSRAIQDEKGKVSDVPKEEVPNKAS
jgi:uncharacterized membrane protein YcaP (DUF421 family)